MVGRSKSACLCTSIGTGRGLVGGGGASGVSLVTVLGLVGLWGEAPRVAAIYGEIYISIYPDAIEETSRRWRFDGVQRLLRC